MGQSFVSSVKDSVQCGGALWPSLQTSNFGQKIDESLSILLVKLAYFVNFFFSTLTGNSSPEGP
jgi:hypothetical protein